MINWEVISSEDLGKIHAIMMRVRSELMAPRGGIPVDRYMDVEMDISAAHLAGELSLERLLTAPKIDFAHDVYEIRVNIDRDTGEMDNCFVPRCAPKAGKE